MVLGFWDSTIGKKFVMAITGIVLFGYVVLHLWGNLKVFAGAKILNNWASFLRIAGDPVFGGSQVLWAVRVLLLTCLVKQWGAEDARTIWLADEFRERFAGLSPLGQIAGLQVLTVVLRQEGPEDRDRQKQQKLRQQHPAAAASEHRQRIPVDQR